MTPSGQWLHSALRVTRRAATALALASAVHLSGCYSWRPTTASPAPAVTVELDGGGSSVSGEPDEAQRQSRLEESRPSNPQVDPDAGRQRWIWISLIPLTIVCVIALVR